MQKGIHKCSHIEKLFINSQKLYYSDIVLYVSLSASESDLFYKDLSSQEWQLLNQYFTSHNFPNSHRVVKAYHRLFYFVQFGNAILSQHNKEDHVIQSYLKKGMLAT